MIKNSKKINILSIMIIIIIAFFSISKVSFASTEVYFQRNVSEIIKGDMFSVDLKISSSNNTINVIDGTVIYDKNLLEIKKVKTDNSIISVWVKEPVFDNNEGGLSFIGGIPGGFKGSNGQVLEITFFAKKEGSTMIGFKDIFSVFVNDGKGTHIDPWLKPMPLSIVKKQNLSSVKNVVNNFVKAKNNTVYYIGMFTLFLLFIIIILFIKLKKNDR